MPERTTLSIGDVTIDYAARRVTRNSDEVKLTKLEFDLLSALARNSDNVLTHRFLLRGSLGTCWPTGNSHASRVFVANLRRKLECDPTRPKLIITEQGVGYRFAAE